MHKARGSSLDKKEKSGLPQAASTATRISGTRTADERWVNQPYGTDNIRDYGCGPTAMPIVVSSLTDNIVDPAQMREKAALVLF